MGTGTNLFGTGTTTSLHVGTGTSKYGIGTTTSLHVGNGIGKYGTGTTASAIAPLHRSTIQGFSIAAAIIRDDLHLFFGHKPL